MKSPSRTSIDGPWIGDLGVFIAVFDVSLMMESARFYRISVFISVVLGSEEPGISGSSAIHPDTVHIAGELKEKGWSYTEIALA